MRLGQQAVAAANVERSFPSAAAPRLWRGLCLKFVRIMLGIPGAVAPNARAAWQNTDAGDRHPDGTPPLGVPVFWEVGTNWHVALSCGGGYVLTTDLPTSGRIGKVPIDEVSRRWGARYLGWTETLGPYRVWTPKPRVRLADVVASLHEANHFPPLVAKALAAEGLENTREGYTVWQHRCGFSGKDADGVPGLKSLSSLGNKHGFKAVP